ncbi:MAG TPA: FAD-dependent oxidoreductase, partial [Dehalococcoidales bacterium]
DKALALINETAPLAGVLGRLCTHPCETKCTREQIDTPVFVQALHRYAADNVVNDIVYTRKAPEGSRKEKVAVIGSGPAGLTAAWELARRGYSPTIFESHAVVGGMLATGIPRFRLPRETREREVDAIKALGVDIKTGVTVGRDVMLADLVDRGYKAFFLAIGAHMNNKLNVPGEDLAEVLDCISLLFSLNLKVGTAVGNNVIVVGGGNSAVDSARSAKRVGKGEVRILCVTDKMTAVKEEVEEATREGIPIDYNVSVVEILGDGEKVTGVRCQRVKKVTFDADGKANIEYIPGSDFTLKADRVVIAIGQRPNSPALNIKNLNLGRNSTIVVDPLTLETNIPGVFAGGDAVTGSNNVVSAMAAGLRAADSIDRYVKGHDLEKGRTLEPPEPVEVDLDKRKAAQYKRAKMPSLAVSRRKGSYEETNLGLGEEAAKSETERCLNCAVCCECMECEQACELKAVNHQDTAKSVEIEAESIINFFSTANNIKEIKKTGVYNLNGEKDGNMQAELAEASAIALSAVVDLKLKDEKRPADFKNADLIPTIESQDEGISAVLVPPPVLARNAGKRTAVFLCRCGDGISSVIDFIKVTEAVSGQPDVYSVQEIEQVCTLEGAKQIRDTVERENIAHLVLAACRCCNLEQICFSCTDRRVACQRNLKLELPPGVNLEFANIREQCAWVHRDNPAGATVKAIELISTGVVRAQRLVPVVYEARPVTRSVIIIGTGLSSLVAAQSLAIQDYRVTFISDFDVMKLKKESPAYQENVSRRLKLLPDLGVKINPWPQSLELNGGPGKYEAVVKYGLQSQHIEAGVVILDLVNAEKQVLEILSKSNLINRVMSRQHFLSSVSSLDSTILHSYTVRETAGVFIIVPLGKISVESQITLGEAAAARASIYLSQTNLQPRTGSVVINAKLCRGCGDCAKLCPYIEIKNETGPGIPSAWIDPALCFGCGACISVCPTGAILQPLQSEIGITAALESLLIKEENAGGVR